MGFMGIPDLVDESPREDSYRALDILDKVDTPSVDEMKIQLQQLVEQGQITPEEAQTYLQSRSEMSNISLDPRFKNAQLDALSSLQDIGANDGLTSADRSQLNQIQTEEDTKARGAREAILQNAQARGISGSGVELLSQMQNAQDSATRSSQRGFDVAAQAQNRALEALKQAGSLGGQLQSNEFSQKSQVADANDAINRFNSQNQQTQANLGVANRNEAQKMNLQNKTNVANTNVDTANKQQQYNKELAQKNFENKLNKANLMAGTISANSANQAKIDAANDQANKQLIGSGLAAAGTVAAAFSDENLKENVEEFNPSDFLDNLTSYKYNYKNPKHGEGKQVGVMAQDVERAAPQMVENTEEGKVIDYNKAGGPLFASLADLHKRLKKVEG